MFEWDTPKDDKRWKDYWEYSTKTIPYFEKLKKEETIKNYSFWSDNTGHVVLLVFFDDEHKFAKAWGDEEFQKLAGTTNRFFDNARVRIMRPSTTSP
jgi:hypothetical protein